MDFRIFRFVAIVVVGLVVALSSQPALLRAAPIPAGDLDKAFLCSRQDVGQPRRDRSVAGEPLRIAGKNFDNGIGTYATSMIPLDVRGKEFSGVVGIDDCGGNNGSSVEFRILGARKILWSSGAMKKGVAKKFRITIPAGTRKIYLAAFAGGDDAGNNADWANLSWSGATTNPPATKPLTTNPLATTEQVSTTNPPATKAPTTNPATLVVRGKDFGLVPNKENDATKALCNALEKLAANGGGILEIEKGEYHFRAENALQMSFYVSNHEQPPVRPVQIPLVDLHNVEIRGNGSTFILHGESLGVLFMDCDNVTLDNVKIDYAQSIFSEAKVVAFKNATTIVEIDNKAFPYEIRDGKLRFKCNGGERGVLAVTAFRAKTKNIVERTSDIVFDGGAEEIAGGRIALRKDFSREGAGVKVGDTLTLRTYERPQPACVIYRATNTTLSDVAISSSFGMALLAQRCKNVAFFGKSGFVAKTAGTFPRPETGRVYSASADATHFSNVAGKVVVANAFFETMLDDALNVHSTCLAIDAIVAGNKLRCRFVHPQSVGFEVFMPGETLRFIKGKTLEPGAELKVAAVEKLGNNELMITLAGNVPAEYDVGDAVENADFQPKVIFRNNLVQNNRARGILVTTPKKVLIENNVFRNVAGSAILLAGDAQGWFESGACENVAIRNNKFENNLTSRFQFTNAIISICPEVKDLANQKKFYHRNILIENNEFNTFDVPLLYALSTQNLTFRNNKIRYNNDFAGWGQKKFRFVKCAGVAIYNNKFLPAGKKISLDDCDLEMTAPEEIGFVAPAGNKP